MKRKLAGMLSVILTMVICCGNYAWANTYDVFTYEVVDGTITITDCKTSVSGELEVPDVINGYTVTAIGPNAFQSCINLTSVIIPSSVTTMDNYAFNGCTKLKKVKLPGTINTVAHYAFKGCTSLTDINLNNIIVIGNGAFEACSSLKTVNLNSTYRIRKEAFRGCTLLESVGTMNKLYEIESGAFMECKSWVCGKSCVSDI